MRPWTNPTSLCCNFFPYETTGLDWIICGFPSGRQPEDILTKLRKSLAMENFYWVELLGGTVRGGWLCGLWLSLLDFGFFEAGWRWREGKNKKLCLLCEQLITLSISTSLLYNGDKNPIIQKHTNVMTLVFTQSLLITMPLTLCNLLCELKHIKNVTLVAAIQGPIEDRTRIIGIWKGIC